MYSYAQAAETMRSMIPVSRFNKGEATKIFDEVTQSGIKIAIKNNKPACVLISLEKYEAMLEEMEDLQLMLEAEKRIAEGDSVVSFQEILSKNDMTEADLKGWEDVEIE